MTRAEAPFFTGLGDLPGGSFASGVGAVSADGSTVVGGSYSVSGWEAYRWTAATGMVGLGDLPGGALESFATGVSADGSIIIGRGSDDEGHRAFRWQDGAMTPLARPSGWTSMGVAAVSADGQVMVGGATTPAGYEAFRWENGVAQAIGDLPGGPVHSEATAVSADGRVVIGRATTSNAVPSTSFRWENGVIQDLHTDYASAISPDGSVVVGGQGEAYRWENGVVAALGDLPGGKPYSSAFGVSEFGRVIVGESGSAPGPEAFLWDAQHGMRSLQDLLTGELGLELTNWYLYGAKAITPDGLTIVGWGYNPAGNQEAWIAHVPEPAALMLLGVGACLMRSWQKRRSPDRCSRLPTAYRRQRTPSEQADIMVRKGLAWPIALACACWPVALRADAPFFMGLGDLPGGTHSSWADAISADGRTVVGTSRSESGREAFRWTQVTGMVGLGDVPGGTFQSGSTGVSADGSVVVGSTNSGSDRQAFRWEAGVMTLLPPSPEGGLTSASGVSADGNVIAGGDGQALRWVGGIPESLGNLGGRYLNSSATAVSADGRVIVGYGFSGTEFEPFRWEDGVMVSLGFAGEAGGVSPDGSVVVGYSSTEGLRAFRWENGITTNLGVLPGAVSSEAYAASAYGQTIVGASAGAFIWDAQHGMRRLQDVLTGDFGLDLTGWWLTEARAITPDGMVIAGYGRTADGSEAWVARLPEPATPMLLGAGVLLAHRRRER